MCFRLFYQEQLTRRSADFSTLAEILYERCDVENVVQTKPITARLKFRDKTIAQQNNQVPKNGLESR
ncbi:hypothetical protein D3C85_1806360 [compost metagenome]